MLKNNDGRGMLFLFHHLVITRKNEVVAQCIVLSEAVVENVVEDGPGQRGVMSGSPRLLLLALLSSFT